MSPAILLHRHRNLKNVPDGQIAKPALEVGAHAAAQHVDLRVFSRRQLLQNLPNLAVRNRLLRLVREGHQGAIVVQQQDDPLVFAHAVSRALPRRDRGPDRCTQSASGAPDGCDSPTW